MTAPLDPLLTSEDLAEYLKTGWEMTDIVERLRDEYDNPKMRWATAQLLFLCGEAADEIERLRAEVAALRARIDAVREIYAGMEGFIAQTAPEGYLQRIVKQMYEAALGGEGKDG